MSTSEATTPTDSNIQVTVDTSSSAAFAASIQQIVNEHAPDPACDVSAHEGLRHITKLQGSIEKFSYRVIYLYYQHRLDREKAAGIPKAQRGKGMPGEVSRGAKITSGAASKKIQTAKALFEDMPHALAALESGEESGAKLEGLVKKLDGSSPAHLRAVDGELADTYGTVTAYQLAKTGVEKLEQIDPALALKRAEAAYKSRYLKFTPEGDGMSRVSGLISTSHADTIEQVLNDEAQEILRSGTSAHPDDPMQEPRTLAQLRVDRHEEIFTAGAFGATDSEGDPVRKAPKKIEIMLLMDVETFFNDADNPVKKIGEGMIPASAARYMLMDEEAEVEVTRLFQMPGEEGLVRMESASRPFRSKLKKLLFSQSTKCANPWCDNVADVADHIKRVADGGATSFSNGRALCRFCNQERENRGWDVRINPDGTTTEILPTGHENIWPKQEWLPAPISGGGLKTGPGSATAGSDASHEADKREGRPVGADRSA